MLESPDPHRVAERVLELARGRPATLGRGRLVCIDGPAGSGKTTLGLRLARLAPEARVVHMDALYDGWTGLGRVGDQLATLLGPLSVGDPGHYRRYDWHAGAYAETVTVPPTPLLVVEGVGSALRDHAALTTVTVWVSAPADLRDRRGLERDGDAVREHWRDWTIAEALHFARERTEERADLVVDGTGLTPPVSGPGAVAEGPHVH